MNSDRGEMSLIEVEDGQTGIIVSVVGGKNLTKRLADLGLVSGTEIKVIRKALFSGPLQVEVSGSRLVLGRGLASKIMVLSNGRK
ncbi:MAG TPA: FeoA family protein [Bacteroidales bacterium]|jgi:ferrous iron transport protein A|nr:FeoA family protein [Bacteroidales bacterium]HPM18088.1 FeoA family protein [Bacteroidales bacterium]HQG77272.1 FeoA family protein [Bacteroidales bacterium]